MSRWARGFTLPELLLVSVLGATLFIASMQILVTNQRAYAAQASQIRAQRSLREAVDLMYAELREISPRGGDLVAMGTSSMTVRSMHGFGVVCDVLTDADTPSLTVLEVAEPFAAGDSVFVFADNAASDPDDGTWLALRITAVDTRATCAGREAQWLEFAGQDARFAAPAGDSVRAGAPIREFTRYTYGLVDREGEAWLGRTTPDGHAVALVGPLQPSVGLEFAYLDGVGAIAFEPADVRQITVTIRTPGGPLGAVTEAPADSIRAVVYTRN